MKIFNCLPGYFIDAIESLTISAWNGQNTYFDIKYIHIDSDSNSFILGGVIWSDIERHIWDIKGINKISINFVDKSSISAKDIFTLPWREPLPTNNIWEQL